MVTRLVGFIPSTSEAQSVQSESVTPGPVGTGGRSGRSTPLA